MAIRTSSKILPSFNMASMTDLVFLLLIFFMITSTLVSPNALKLLLPQSNNQTSAKAITSVSITKDLRFYVETAPVALNDLERQLQLKLVDAADPTISLHVDKSVPMEEVVKVMNIAARNRYKLILATAPEIK
jgi:biopolymer transport protein ExbD